jgi:hypothetical protein
VIYVHGYYTNLDSAWAEHHLAEQFAASGLNALFIAPEAPSGSSDDVYWKNPRKLLQQIRRARIGVPKGPVVVVGHSGAYRTIVQWLAWPRIKEIILLDGLYENEDDFEQWLRKRRTEKSNRLILVGSETVIRSESFCERFRSAATLPAIPTDVAEFSRRERRSRLLYLVSQYEHMAIITEGKVMPMLLQLTPIAGSSRPRKSQG